MGHPNVECTCQAHLIDFRSSPPHHFCPFPYLHSCPGQRNQCGLAVHDASGRMFVFGGQGSTGILDDTWEFDLNTGNWTRIATTGPTPPARFRCVVWYDVHVCYICVFVYECVCMCVSDFHPVLAVAWSCRPTTLERIACSCPPARVLAKCFTTTFGKQRTQGYHTRTPSTDSPRPLPASLARELNTTTREWRQLLDGSGPAPEPRYGSSGGSYGGELVVTHGFSDERFDSTWWGAASGWTDGSPSDKPFKRCLHGGGISCIFVHQPWARTVF